MITELLIIKVRGAFAMYTLMDVNMRYHLILLTHS